jgi:hypothetical protein
MSLRTGRDWQERQEAVRGQAAKEDARKNKGTIVEVVEDPSQFAENLRGAFEGVPGNKAVRLTLTARGQERTGYGVYPRIGARIWLSLPTRGAEADKTTFYSVGTRGKSRGDLRYERASSNKLLDSQGQDPDTGYLFSRSKRKISWTRK